MNYLAHIFLSGDNPSRKVGNFIGDFVKGKQYQNYPSEIRKGIVLHRRIDHFTDNHIVVKEAVQLLRSTFGRYSAIVLDLYFDYILANNIACYAPNSSLTRIARSFYVSATLRYWYLPKKVRKFIWHFIITNRLEKYKTLEGLEESLKIMASFKTPHISPEEAIFFLKENRVWIENSFHQFFPELITYVADCEKELSEIR